MKIEHFGVILLILLGFSFMIPAYAQKDSLTVTTDQQAYSEGNQMVISGTAGSQLNVPISIVVRDPTGNIVLIGQVTPNPDGTYSTTVTAGGDLWTAPGTYQVTVTYGSKNNTASTNFQFAGSLLTAPITIQGQVYNATYSITNGKVLGIIPTPSSKSITIRIQPSGTGLMSITLPRSLIDAKANGQDSQYVVEDDGVQTQFNETRSDAVSRTLSIPFQSANSQITIIGTQIVPEFGELALAVLSLAILGTILGIRSKLNFRV